MSVKSGKPTGAGKPRGTAEQRAYYGTGGGGGISAPNLPTPSETLQQERDERASRGYKYYYNGNYHKTPPTKEQFQAIAEAGGQIVITGISEGQLKDLAAVWHGAPPSKLTVSGKEVTREEFEKLRLEAKAEAEKQFQQQKVITEREAKFREAKKQRREEIKKAAATLSPVQEKSFLQRIKRKEGESYLAWSRRTQQEVKKLGISIVEKPLKRYEKAVAEKIIAEEKITPAGAFTYSLLTAVPRTYFTLGKAPIEPIKTAREEIASLKELPTQFKEQPAVVLAGITGGAVAFLGTGLIVKGVGRAYRKYKTPIAEVESITKPYRAGDILKFDQTAFAKVKQQGLLGIKTENIMIKIRGKTVPKETFIIRPSTPESLIKIYTSTGKKFVTDYGYIAYGRGITKGIGREITSLIDQKYTMGAGAGITKKGSKFISKGYGIKLGTTVLAEDIVKSTATGDLFVLPRGEYSFWGTLGRAAKLTKKGKPTAPIIEAGKQIVFPVKDLETSTGGTQFLKFKGIAPPVTKATLKEIAVKAAGFKTPKEVPLKQIIPTGAAAIIPRGDFFTKDIVKPEDMGISGAMRKKEQFFMPKIDFKLGEDVLTGTKTRGFSLGKMDLKLDLGIKEMGLQAETIIPKQMLKMDLGLKEMGLQAERIGIKQLARGKAGLGLDFMPPPVTTGIGGGFVGVPIDLDLGLPKSVSRDFFTPTQPKGYAPSLIAFEFDIFEKRKSKRKKLFTGLELRPIPLNFRGI